MGPAMAPKPRRHGAPRRVTPYTNSTRSSKPSTKNKTDQKLSLETFATCRQSHQCNARHPNPNDLKTDVYKFAPHIRKLVPNTCQVHVSTQPRLLRGASPCSEVHTAPALLEPHHSGEDSSGFTKVPSANYC